MVSQFVNPFTDFGFKKLFGEEASKPLLKDFLNSLLPATAQIKALSFQSGERLGRRPGDRRAIFDISCESESGEKFIVEMQKEKQKWFKDRTVFYASFPIQEQAQKGEWDFELAAVYCVGILDFRFDEPGESAEQRAEVLHTVCLKNQHNQVFYDKLTLLYLEMPNFQKTEAQLETRLDQWLYFLKHLEDFEEIPRIFGGEEVFETAFQISRLAAMGREERYDYEMSLKVYRDNFNVVRTARDEGWEQGREVGLEQGREQGMQQGLNDALRRLMDSGMEEGAARKLLGL